MLDPNQFIVLLHWQDSTQIPLIAQAADWLIENNILVTSAKEIGHHYTAKMVTFTDPELATIFKLKFRDLVVSEKFLQEKFPTAL